MWTSINGRVLEHSNSSNMFQQVIMEKTKKMIPSGRYPLCLVLIQLKPNLVIWDASPKKSGVQVMQCIQQDLMDKISFCIDRALEISDGVYKEDSEWTNPMLWYPLQRNNAPQSSDTFQKWRVAGQVKNTYVVVETEASVLLLEQHVAHEGVLFEKLFQLWRSKTEWISFCSIPSPLLLQGVPQIVIERLKQLHIHSRSLDGRHTWAIDEIPQIIFDMLHKKNSSSMEAQLIRMVDPQRNLEDNLADFACRCAWKNGMQLTEVQMNTLVDEWIHMKGNKRTCPHGRPIFIQLDENYLSRLFKRNWTNVDERN